MVVKNALFIYSIVYRLDMNKIKICDMCNKQITQKRFYKPIRGSFLRKYNLDGSIHDAKLCLEEYFKTHDRSIYGL